jgi:hypothetical protein
MEETILEYEKRMPVREPPPRKPATKFKTKLLIKVSEQAR